MPVLINNAAAVWCAGKTKVTNVEIWNGRPVEFHRLPAPNGHKSASDWGLPGLFLPAARYRETCWS